MSHTSKINMLTKSFKKLISILETLRINLRYPIKFIMFLNTFIRIFMYEYFEPLHNFYQITNFDEILLIINLIYLC